MPARAGGEDFGDRHLFHLMLSVDMGVCRDVRSAMVAKRESMVTEPSPRRQRQPVCGSLFDALGAARIYDVAQQAPRVRGAHVDARRDRSFTSTR